jgi:hypothetical protein
VLPFDVQLVAHRQPWELAPNQEAACATFRGTLRGNDPHAKAELELCRHGEVLAGTLTWTSSLSGDNVRLVSGRVEGEQVILEDVGLLRATPNAEWQFCPIDEYRLTVGANGTLKGTYWSAACRDRAQVELAPID